MQLDQHLLLLLLCGRAHVLLESTVRDLKARKGLGRAQTFAFGQRETHVDASPTGAARPSARHYTIAMLGGSPMVGDRASFARRMPSY